MLLVRYQCLKDRSSHPEAFCEKVFLQITRKFTGKHLYQSLYRLEACNFIKKTPTTAYFRQLLRAVPAHNALFQFLRAFSHSKLRIGMLCRGVSSLNLSFFLFLPHACPAFLKYALPTQAFSGELFEVFKNTYSVEQLQTAASEKSYFLHMFFQLKVPLFTNNFTQVMFS